MKSFNILLVFLLLTFSTPVFAENTDTNEEPSVRGEAAVLLDVQSGQTLYAKNPDEQLPPASTTKIMTSLLAIENCNLDDIVTVSQTMLNNDLVYGTMIYLSPGEKLSLRDLLYATLLNSANDAAVAVAEKTGGDVSHFVEMMNERAKAIGTTNTHFQNPSGLHNDQHYTTAHDLALIAQTAYQNPVFAQFVSTKKQAIQRNIPDVPIEMINENRLLWSDSTVNGIKTGYTTEAGNCLVASATRGDRQLIAVILKSSGKEMYSDMSALLDYGFNCFETKVVHHSGESMGSLQISHNTVNMLLSNPIYETLAKDNPQTNLHLQIVNTINDIEKIEKGQTVAELEIWDNQQCLGIIPLQADKTVYSFFSLFYVKRVLLIIGLLIVIPTLILHFIRLREHRKRRQERMNRREALREKYNA